MAAPQVVSATPSLDASGRPTRVVVVFDQAIDTASGLLDPLSYSIDGGLLVTGAVFDAGFPLQVQLITTEQVLDRPYTVFVSGSLKLAAPPFTPLNIAYASARFLGLAAPSDYVVVNLRATTDPRGRGIDLFWTNPTGVTHCRVYRRLRAWPFDLSDPSTLVYDGTAIDPTNTTPDEPKLSDSGLLDDTFYYYTVVVRQAPASFTQTAASRISALSGRTRDEQKSTDYVTRLVPRGILEADRKMAGEYGKFLAILGGSTDLYRSVVRSAFLRSDWTRSPYDAVKAWSRALGFSPEGETYDYDTPRRVLLQLRELYSKKGSLPGIVQAANALVQWTVDTEEFGLDESTRMFGTPDITDYDSNSGAAITFLGSEIQDSSRAWAELQWQGGRVRDGLGNWFDVIDTTGGTQMILADLPSATSRYRTALTAVAGIGSNTITVDSVLGLVAGQRIQLFNTATGVGQILEITYVDSVAKVLYFWNQLSAAYPIGAAVSWRVTKPEASIASKTAVGSGLNTIVMGVFGAPLSWPIDRWVGLQVKDSGGGIHTVTSSGAASLTFADGFVWAPGADFTIARSFTAGVANPYYEVHTGYMPLLYDPLFDFGLRGTRFDPFHYFYGGRASLGGVFGPCDLGLYVDQDWLGSAVEETASRCTSVAGGVLTDTSAGYAVNAFVGMVLIPNQNVPTMFEITANTATTISAAGDLTKYAVPGQGYVVLTKRNAERYNRLLARINEFAGDDVCVRVLFL